jgi:hypothetical protein
MKKTVSSRLKRRDETSWQLAVSRMIALAIFLSIFNSQYSFGQASSPYSRFGLGYVSSPVFSANKAMGGVAAPYASGININYANPASYASLTRTTIEIGMNAEGSKIRTGDSTYTGTSANINHFALAFVPNIKHNNFAVSIGLLPYSYANYTFIQDFNDSALGPFRQVYSGKGSLYQAYVGAAYKVKGFSVGANLGFLFGKLDYQKTITFSDTLYAYSTRNITSMNVKSFVYSVGVQYQHLIYHNSNDPDSRTDIFMTTGLYGSGGMKMQAKVSNYWDRFTVDPTYGVLTVDTVQANFNQKQSINLPFNIGTGIMFGNERFWMLGTDFKFMNWANYSSPLNNGGLGNSWRLSFGAQITPKFDEVDKKKYLSRVQYRAGAYYGKSEIKYNGKQLNEVGGTIGFGFPFKNVAHLNLTGDFGSRGSSEKTAISETYYRFTFGFVLNDIWFIKRKFD